MFKILLIGNKNSGKTTYLSKLSMQPEITIKNKETLQYLHKQSTSKFISLEFNYKNIVSFQIDDYDGEIIDNFHQNEDKLLSVIKSAQAVLLFIPYDKKNNLYNQIDLFIQNLDKNIPINIVISKYEIDENIEQWLKNSSYNQMIKKLKIYFKNISIIPISSFNNINILTPIENSINSIFNNIEQKITTLKKEELLIFLYSILDDIQYYKNYLELYNNIENELFNTLYKKLQNVNSYKDFKQILKQNKDIIKTFNPKHQEEIKILEKYYTIDFSKQIGIISTAIFIFGIITFIAFKNKKEYENKIKLSKQIEISYENNNTQNTLNLINKYQNNYSSLPKKLIKIRQILQTKCQKEISIQYQTIFYINSILKKHQLLAELEDEIKTCNITQRPFIIQKEFTNNLYSKYLYLKKEIQNLTLNNIQSLDTIKFNNTLLQIQNYPEYNKTKEYLNQKFKILTNISSNKENIKSLINKAIQLNLDKLTITKLNEKLNYIKFQEALNQLIDEIEPMDYDEALSYIKINWEKHFNTYINLEKIKQILNEKFNQKLTDILSETNDIFISNSNDLNLFKTELDKIYNLSHKKIKLIKYSPQINISNKSIYKTLRKKYYKYNKSYLFPTKIKFIADNINNKPLQFTCEDNKEIEIKIIRRKIKYIYNYKNAKCNKTTLIFGNNHHFYIGNYNIKITQFNTFFDEHYNSTFKISKNDIINLINHNIVKKEIGNGYSLEFIP